MDIEINWDVALLVYVNLNKTQVLSENEVAVLKLCQPNEMHFILILAMMQWSDRHSKDT